MLEQPPNLVQEIVWVAEQGAHHNEYQCAHNTQIDKEKDVSQRQVSRDHPEFELILGFSWGSRVEQELVGRNIVILWYPKERRREK